MLLTRLMYQQYGKPVILLIDEYDVPVAKANRNGYYEDVYKRQTEDYREEKE